MNMGVYGDTAIAAVVEIIKKSKKNIRREIVVAAWEEAVQTKTESETSRRKVCPKAAFIGLCENNYVKDIIVDNPTKENSANKVYAKEAADYLLSLGDSTKQITQQELWQQIKEPKALNENGQMQVVIALWRKKMLQNPEKIKIS